MTKPNVLLMGETRAEAVDAAVRKLNQDMAVVDATLDEHQRAQLRAEAEQRYLNAVIPERGGSDV